MRYRAHSDPGDACVSLDGITQLALFVQVWLGSGSAGFHHFYAGWPRTRNSTLRVCLLLCKMATTVLPIPRWRQGPGGVVGTASRATRARAGMFRKELKEESVRGCVSSESLAEQNGGRKRLRVGAPRVELQS